MRDDQFGWLDALHLASASLPIGGFAYSQGLEQACHIGLVNDAGSAQTWIADYLLLVLARQEMPLWLAVFQASHSKDWETVCAVTQRLHALRETAELRLESRQMAHAMVRLYDQWLMSLDKFNGEMPNDGDRFAIPHEVVGVLQQDYTAAHAALCGARQIEPDVAMTAWLWSWLDNQVLAAVKLVPLGQRDGQAILHAVKPKLIKAMDIASHTPLHEAGSAPLGLVLASTQHETQYARLFRS
ncbi:MAG: urease accessory protein UreF [Burkholderiaceae bacterium]|nr:urease accessory protein UreF [Burkholderiaceae bacterium]MCD8537076.1 urease accessory protein UreF [Burkholderiaceae bacterium]MCD8564486.1 urease accessory protein UreF [Burkholderiaceae bacterium]